jgi:sugar lactone lactonase YvrE
MNRRQALTGIAAATAATVLVTPQRAGAHTGDLFPTTIPLPDNWLPEGITISPYLPLAYFGSRADGSIYRANLATGEGEIIHTGPGAGFPSVGLKIDGAGRLFVAGGNAGQARVVSAIGGRLLATYQFTTATSFVNDVILTPSGAFFTDSRQAFLYRLPMRPFGALPRPDGFVRIPLTGAMVLDPAVNNANGIVRTPDGRGLIIVQSNTGLLFHVNPATGVTTQVNVGGATFAGGDGMLLDGRTLYIVRNRLEILAVVRLSRDGRSGTVAAEIRLPDDLFDVPTTVAKFSSRATGDRLYFPNAKFRAAGEPIPTEFEAVGIPVPRV